MAFADLDADVVRRIAALLRCGVDRENMAAACPAWGHAIRMAPLAPSPHRLAPLLFFPNSKRKASFSCLMCGGELKALSLPYDVSLEGRLFGSYAAGWVMTAKNHSNGNIMVNVRSGEHFPLPDSMQFDLEDCSYDVIVHLATISKSPDHADCYGAALVERLFPEELFREPVKDLMFWKGSGLGWGMKHQAIEPALVEDILYFGGRFLLLTAEEQVISVRPRFDHWTFGADIDRMNFIVNHLYEEGEVIIARYLVQSRGEFLMVSRSRSSSEPRKRDSKFRVFSADEIEMDEGPIPELIFFIWRELHVLDGRMIFIGRGCSRSYEISDFQGAAEGVYFMDDDLYWSEDWEIMQGPERAAYMADCGRCPVPLPPSGEQDECFRLAAQLEQYELYSPTAWIFP